MIRVSVDKNDYDNLMKTLKSADKNTKSGLKKVINQTARDAKKEILRRTREEYVVKKKYFGTNQIKINSATNSKLMASLLIVGRPIHLREFRSQKHSGGNAAKAFVKKGNAYKALETEGLKAFVAKMSNGKVVILRRKGSDRHPVKALYGPGQAQMARTVYAKIEREVQGSLRNNINSMIERIVGGKL